MTYHLEETLWLAENGLDNLLLGYPYTFKNSFIPLIEHIKNGKNITFMVDLPVHLEILNELGKQLNVKVPICLDLDMSTDFGWIWFGVKRSSIRNLEQLKERVQLLKKLNFIQLKGIMGYEAQIAGLGEKQNDFLKRLAIPILKKISIKNLSKKRKQMFDFLQKEGFDLKIVNGGGTGSIEKTIQEPYINEVTVGSGLYSSGLFDMYNDFCHEPALFFGLEITRNPEPNVYTCAGGGYIASGSIGVEKQPKAFLPKDLKFLKDEGFGEVQTPFYSKNPLKIGECIFLRHAKAGELCERFQSIYIFDNEKIIDQVPTYRGEGKCFL
ncbi:MAG: amino acid aldolase [Bacteroidia bacterium]|nr:MAG: amino acid aldolase [Bacteroidia bacterium]